MAGGRASGLNQTNALEGREMEVAITFWYGVLVLFVFLMFILYPRRDGKPQNWIVGIAVAVCWPVMAAWFIPARALPWIVRRFYADASALLSEHPKQCAIAAQPESKDYVPGQWAGFEAKQKK